MCHPKLPKFRSCSLGRTQFPKLFQSVLGGHYVDFDTISVNLTPSVRGVQTCDAKRLYNCHENGIRWEDAQKRCYSVADCSRPVPKPPPNVQS